MQYMVVGADGNEYGPATIDTLKQWAAENRLSPGTQLRDFQTGQLLMASAVPGVFQTPPPAVTAPTQYADYSRPPDPSVYSRTIPSQYSMVDDGKHEFSRSLFRCGLALVFFFIFRWLGIFSAIYALIYAFQARGKGHQYGNIAIAVAVLVLVFIILGNVYHFGGYLSPPTSP